MIIYYDSLNEQLPGEHQIFYSVPDARMFYFSHTTNIPLETIEVEEVDPENKELCNDMLRFAQLGKVDENGLGKYFVDDSGEIVERLGWEEYQNDL